MQAVIAISLLCLLCVGGRAGGWRALSPRQVLVDYKPEQPTFSLHEPVIVTFEVRNALSEPVSLTLGAESRQFFEFSLTMPDGKTIRGETPPGWNVETVTFGSGKIVIRPGADYHQTLLMNQWFRFEREGTYFLTARLTTDIETSMDGTIAPESRDIRIHIGPRDPEHLSNLCAELTKDVQQAQTVDSARGAALDLSYVDDPVAVPFLGQALVAKAGSFDYLIVPALEKVGDAQAIELLLTALGSTSGDVSDQAEAALHHLKGRISDASLKQRVTLALEAKAATRRR